MGTCPGPSSWSRSRSRPRRQDPGSLALNLGRCHVLRSSSSGGAPASATPRERLLRGTRFRPQCRSPRRRSAARAAAPCSWGTPELVVRGLTPRHASCGGENSNPQATTRGQDRAVPVIQEGPLTAPRSAPRPQP